MTHSVSAFFSLYVFWLLLSGYFTPFLMTAGAGCALAVVLFTRRMQVLDPEGQPLQLVPRTLTYWPWLLMEVLKSGWDVSRIIVDPRLPISPTLVRFKPSQKTTVGLVTHANSITLTPGTLTVERRGRRVRRARAHARRRRRHAQRRDGRPGAGLRGRALMFAAAALALLVTLTLAVVRAALGPTLFDRVQAANTIGTVAMLLLSVLGFLTGRPEFLDLALVYGLLNVVGTVAVLKFFRYGDLGDPGDTADSAGKAPGAGS